MTDELKRIGLIVGREWSFPPAFIDEVNGRDAGVVAELARLDITRAGANVPYAVLIDRISHEIPFYRSYLKAAALQGVNVINNPFMWSADDKYFGASLLTRLGVAHPKTIVLPNHSYADGIGPEDLANLQYPLDWPAIVDYIGLPAILKDAHGGGWKEVHRVDSLDELIAHYNESAGLTMILQEFIAWNHYVRCMCIGQDRVMPIKYDPQARRYHLEHAHMSDDLGATVVTWAQRINAGARLRYEHRRVRGPRRGALCHRLHEPGPRHGHLFPDTVLFRLGRTGHGRPGHRAGHGAPSRDAAPLGCAARRHAAGPGRGRGPGHSSSGCREITRRRSVP